LVHHRGSSDGKKDPHRQRGKEERKTTGIGAKKCVTVRTAGLIRHQAVFTWRSARHKEIGREKTKKRKRKGERRELVKLLKPEDSSLR